METIYYTYTKIENSEPLPSMVLVYYDITFVISGVLHYYLNGKKADVCENDVIVFRYRDNRIRDAGGYAEYYSFNFTWGDEPYIKLCPQGVLKNCISHELKELLYLYDQCHNSFSIYEKEKCANYLSNILFSLIECANHSSQNLNVEMIKRYIAQHIRENITLDDISRSISFSPNYCTHIFKKETGMSIIDYIIREKIQIARFEILKQDKTLTEISNELGYKEYSYFSRTFKNIYGLSPLNYREKNKSVR